MADGILTPCNVACGFGIVTVNSPSGSTLQCDTWLWDYMPLNSAAGSILQCGRWLWDDIPLNLPKHPPYWNSTSSFDFDHITAVDMSFAPVCEIISKSDHPRQDKNDVMLLFKMADLSHLGL